MLSTALLTALLEAERALGRLAEACENGDQRRRLWADAARREARAAARLDGIAIDGTDVLIATINPDLTGTADRPAALAAHALWQGARFAQGLRDRPTPHPRARVARGPATNRGPSGARTGTQGAAAEVWRAVALLERGEEEGRRFDHADDDDVDDDVEGDVVGGSLEERSHSIADGDSADPLTVRWIENAWRALEADVSGRDPAALRLSAAQEADAAVLLDRLERAGQAPALLGAVGMLAELVRPVPDQRTPAWLRPTMRLLATRTIAHHCRLPGLWLPLSTGLSTDRTAAAIAARSGDEAWRLWLTDMVAETARRERQRLATLDQTAQSWRRRMGERRSNSRLPEVIDGLFDTPAFTVRHLQQRLGTTFRGAQLLVNDLVAAGVLRDVTNRALDRVFVAVELLP